MRRDPFVRVPSGEELFGDLRNRLRRNSDHQLRGRMTTTPRGGHCHRCCLLNEVATRARRNPKAVLLPADYAAEIDVARAAV